MFVLYLGILYNSRPAMITTFGEWYIVPEIIEINDIIDHIMPAGTL